MSSTGGCIDGVRDGRRTHSPVPHENRVDYSATGAKRVLLASGASLPRRDQQVAAPGSTSARMNQPAITEAPAARM
jgi:hypothetical protein